MGHGKSLKMMFMKNIHVTNKKGIKREEDKH